ncbi:MAG: T9SS type A sorting domain-containing protein [Saprospiraceae bacterium]|nr:T9SS type A sorting domain-containing protein [Saprospiraceae bacterium]
MKWLLRIACTVMVALNLAAAQPSRLIDQVYPVFPFSSIDDGTSRSVLDTVLYPIFGDECALEAVTVGIQGWGRISGMNVFGDLEKAQRLEFNGSENFTVVGALVFFEKPGIVGNSAVNCKIYSEHPTTGAPFATKGFSNAVKMSEILFDEETPVATPFSFADGVDVNLTEPGFFVSVDFSNLYASRDTLVILQTIPDCGDGGNSWELHSDGVSWLPISSFSTWGINADFLITAVVDFNDPTSVNDFISSRNLKLFPASPNPAQDHVQLNFSLEKPESVDIEVYDQQGRLIHREQKKSQSGKCNHLLNTSDLENGIYYYRLLTPSISLASRFLVSR